MEDQYEKAVAIGVTNPLKASTILSGLVKSEVSVADEESIRIKELAILELGGLLKQTGQANELASLIKFSRPFLQHVSKAKAAKLVRTLVEQFLDMDATTGQEVNLCKECIDWSKNEKRTFLRQALETRLISLYFDTKCYADALKLGGELLRELKKLDDKVMLVEVQLLESKVYHALSNLPKSRAALTTARTTANGIYCPPKLQASLDLQSGILHAAEEKDFKTAFSYFYEAFEGYDSIEPKKAPRALKYMLLCKIMLHYPDEVTSLTSSKLGIKYSGTGVEAMKQIARASEKRSLADFQQTVNNFKSELEDDGIVKLHLISLYDHLLEQNLCRIIEPYSRVQVDHIAKLIDLPLHDVEKKLSQMILDKKFNGILDQGKGVLIVFDESKTDETYKCTLDTISGMTKVIEALYTKAKRLT